MHRSFLKPAKNATDFIEDTQGGESQDSDAGTAIGTGKYTFSQSRFSLHPPRKLPKDELEALLCFAKAAPSAFYVDLYFNKILLLLNRHPNLANYVSKTLNLNPLELAVKLNQTHSISLIMVSLEKLHCKLRPEVKLPMPHKENTFTATPTLRR